MERGELDGVCGSTGPPSRRSAALDRRQERQRRSPRPPFHKDPDLPDVPLIMELTSDPRSCKFSSCSCRRMNSPAPYAAPPDIPADRAAALITAFEATTKDPAFLAETAQHQMEVAPVSGKKLAQMLNESSTARRSRSLRRLGSRLRADSCAGQLERKNALTRFANDASTDANWVVRLRRCGRQLLHVRPRPRSERRGLLSRARPST